MLKACIINYTFPLFLDIEKGEMLCGFSPFLCQKWLSLRLAEFFAKTAFTASSISL
jgi:hypothetical protein